VNAERPHRRRRREPDRADAIEVVLVPPRPEEADAAWQRWVETLDWLVTLGAMDA
jgi:hypothetical protein